jgi:hypothetical protein
LLEGEYNRIETIQVCSKEQELNRIETIQVCSKEQELNRIEAERVCSLEQEVKQIESELYPKGRESNRSESEGGKEAGETVKFSEILESDEAILKEFEMEPLKSVDLSELNKQRRPDEVMKLKKFLVKYKSLLSDGILDYKTNPNPKHNTRCTITTIVSNPKVVSTNRAINPADLEESKKIILQKVKEGVIEPSSAPWSSNSVLVKKDGKLRMVIDYRALNKVTVKDAYPMPRIQDLTDCLGGTKWFTGVDCVQAFHQIPMADERSKDLTTFRGPAGGLFRYRYMPMGLVNAMAVWSRFIDSVMERYAYQCVLCYADDCLIYTRSENVDDHIQDLEKIFSTLDSHGIKIKASKLKLGCKTMPFLGVVITENGIEPNPEKTKAITSLQYPTTLKQLRRIWGFLPTTENLFQNLVKEQLHFMLRRRSSSRISDKGRKLF